MPQFEMKCCQAVPLNSSLFSKLAFVLLWNLEAAVSMATNPRPNWGTTAVL